MNWLAVSIILLFSLVILKLLANNVETTNIFYPGNKIFSRGYSETIAGRNETLFREQKKYSVFREQKNLKCNNTVDVSSHTKETASTLYQYPTSQKCNVSLGIFAFYSHDFIQHCANISHGIKLIVNRPRLGQVLRSKQDVHNDSSFRPSLMFLKIDNNFNFFYPCSVGKKPKVKKGSGIRLDLTSEWDSKSQICKLRLRQDKEKHLIREDIVITKRNFLKEINIVTEIESFGIQYCSTLKVFYMCAGIDDLDRHGTGIWHGIFCRWSKDGVNWSLIKKPILTGKQVKQHVKLPCFDGSSYCRYMFDGAMSIVIIKKTFHFWARVNIGSQFRTQFHAIFQIADDMTLKLVSIKQVIIPEGFGIYLMDASFVDDYGLFLGFSKMYEIDTKRMTFSGPTRPCLLKSIDGTTWEIIYSGKDSYFPVEYYSKMPHIISFGVEKDSHGKNFRDIATFLASGVDVEATKNLYFMYGIQSAYREDVKILEFVLPRFGFTELVFPRHAKQLRFGLHPIHTPAKFVEFYLRYVGPNVNFMVFQCVGKQCLNLRRAYSSGNKIGFELSRRTYCDQCTNFSLLVNASSCGVMTHRFVG